MAARAVLFEEWHLRWWISDTVSPADRQQLRSAFSTPEFQQQVETMLSDLLQRTPTLQALHITIVL